MLKYTVSLVLFVLLGTWSLFNAIYCAWLTATPLTPERLRVAQTYFYAWLAAFAAALIISLIIVIRMIRLRRSPRIVEATRAV
jgi:hypothetical protein